MVYSNWRKTITRHSEQMLKGAHSSTSAAFPMDPPPWLSVISLPAQRRGSWRSGGGWLQSKQVVDAGGGGGGKAASTAVARAQRGGEIYGRREWPRRKQTVVGSFICLPICPSWSHGQVVSDIIAGTCPVQRCHMPSKPLKLLLNGCDISCHHQTSAQQIKCTYSNLKRATLNKER